jgi:hypothetical protein
VSEATSPKEEPFGYIVATVPGTVRRAWADAGTGSGELPTTAFLQRARP